MQVLALLRTVSIGLVGLSACFALGASAGQKEKPDTNLRSPMTSIGARNDSVASDESNVYIAKHNESRAITGGRVGEQVSKELLNTSLTPTRTSSSLHSFSSAVERFRNAATLKVDIMTNAVARLLKHSNWRNLIETTEISWEVDAIRELVMSYCLEARESPAHTFRYLKVHLYSGDTQSYDPRLLWWFDYVEKYRGLGGVSTIETAKSDTATSHAVFDDKELFAFLVHKYDLQTGKDTSSAVLSPNMTPLDSRQHVVALFEWLRHQSGMKKLAEGMQLYLVSNSNTEQLVFHKWLQGRVSPIIVFDILRVDSQNTNGMFFVWLKYIEMYWNNVFSGSDEQYFYYDVFLRFLAEKSSWNAVMNLLKSRVFHQVFGKVPQHGFGNHAKNLQAMYIRWQWLYSGASPRDIFRYLSPSGKFELGDTKFLQGCLYVDLYRVENRFTNKELFDVLSEKNSFEEIVRLFRWLLEYWGTQEIARDMLRYLVSLPIVQNARVTQTLRQYFLKKRKRTP